MVHPGIRTLGADNSAATREDPGDKLASYQYLIVPKYSRTYKFIVPEHEL